LFAGLGALLDRLDAARIPWGVVTNKPSRMTTPLLAHLQLAERAACAVSGDSLAVRKPHPGPLLHACQLAGVAPAEAIYVGDAARDIEAGRAAGMGTIAVAYGYIVAGDDPAAWGADHIAANTEELAQIVCKAVNLVS
jgi:N-acetyl-D-muramate 6-phosphate phosphatase